ncbi:MAG: tail fiber domain-containing protein [Gemmobacter sp.]
MTFANRLGGIALIGALAAAAPALSETSTARSDGSELQGLAPTGVTSYYETVTPPGDNLGNHTAIGTLMMGSNNISGINAAFASVYFHTSDRRLKTEIVPLEGLGVVARLIPVSYRMKADGRPAMGFVAQDVAAEFPDLVATDPMTGIMSVEYDQIVAPLVAAVQERAARGLTLAAELARLRDAPRLIEAAAP